MNLIEQIENILESGRYHVSAHGYETMEAALEELKKRKWIPVTERVPEKSGCYLVIVNDGLNNPVCEIISYRNSLWNIFDHEKVTHWMELPEMPHDR